MYQIVSISPIKYKNLKKVLGLVCSILLFCNVSANPVMAGADITYKCTSTPGIYEITLVVYRNCTSPVSTSICPDLGCSGPCSQTVQLRGADPSCNNTLLSNITVSLISVRDVNINPDCPNSTSNCTNRRCKTGGIYILGIERFEFKGFVNLGPTSGIPSGCCNVRLSWQAPSPLIRSILLNTVSLGGSDRFFIDAVINRCLSVSPCNSSPELTNEPVAVICGGQNFVYNNGAFDADGDSLSFAFTPALSSNGSLTTYIPPSSLIYIPPYTFDKPMPWLGSPTAPFPAGISCNPTTGDIMFTPGNTSSQDFYGVVAIEIKQWKTINGVPTVIGTTKRDIQMIVKANCPPNNPPRLLTNPPNTSNANTPRTQWEVCAGEKLCFTVIAKDTDFTPPTRSDSTKLTWNGSLASLGATFQPAYTHTQAQRSIFGPREDGYQFCWTPTPGMASNIPYYFTVSAKDNGCPDPGRITRAFSIKVLPKAAVLIRKLDLKCGQWKVWYDRDTSAKGGKPNVPYTSTTWVIASVPEDLLLNQNPTVFTSTSTPPTVKFATGGRYLLELRITTQGPAGEPHCMQIFRDTLLVDTFVQANVRDTFSCVGSSVQLNATAKFGTPNYSYRWFNSLADTSGPALNAPNFATGAFTVNPTNARYYTVQVRDVNGCRSYDSSLVSIKSLPTSSLIDSVRICRGDTFTFNAGNNGGKIRSYLWSSGDTTQTISKQDSGRFIVLLTDSFGCTQRDTAMLFVNQPIIANAGIDAQLCLGDSVQLKPTGGQSYQWMDINNPTSLIAQQRDGRIWIKPTNTISPTLYRLTAFVTYPDTVSNYKLCFQYDTISIKVNALPVLARPSATLVCRSTPLLLLPNFTVTNGQGGGTGVWTYPPSSTAITPSGTQLIVDSLKNNPRKDTNTLNPFINWVKYSYTSPITFGGCTKIDSAQIMMYANPRINAGLPLRWCSNAGNYPITGNRSYSLVATVASGDVEQWSGNGIVQTATSPLNRFVFNPMAPEVIQGANTINFTYTRNYNNLITCQSQDTATFIVSNPPTINAGIDLALCSNEPQINLTNKTGATLTPNSGAGFWRISSPAGADIAIVNGRQDLNASAIVFPTGASSVLCKGIYTDTATGCNVRDTMDIQITRAPQVTLLYDNALADSIYVCHNSKQVYFRAWNVLPNNSRVEISANASNSELNGSSAFTFNTNLGINTSRLVMNSSGDLPSQYNLRYTFTDQSTPLNCKDSDSTMVYILPPPSIGVNGVSEVCSNDTLIEVSLAAGEPTPSNINFKWTPMGDGVYVNESASATQYITGINERVSGKAILRAITLPRDISNLPGKTQTGTTILGNSEQCAAASDSTHLVINAAPVAAILASNPDGCEPLTTQLAANNTGIAGALFNWQWENNTRPSKTDSAITEVQTNYEINLGGMYKTRLIVSTPTNPPCVDTSEWQTMQVRALPKPSFYSNPESRTIANPFFDFVNQTASPDNAGLSYRWNLGPDPDPKKTGDRISNEYSPVNIEFPADTANQPIWLTAISEYGCVDSTLRFIRIDPDISVFIASAFRPSSSVDCPDGTACNREFIVAADGYQSIDIYVFNRWGQQVFYTNDAKIGWNGKMRVGNENNIGDICPQDVYIYQINATSFANKKYKYSGSVTLLR